MAPAAHASIDAPYWAISSPEMSEEKRGDSLDVGSAQEPGTESPSASEPTSDSQSQSQSQSPSELNDATPKLASNAPAPRTFSLRRLALSLAVLLLGGAFGFLLLPPPPGAWIGPELPERVKLEGDTWTEAVKTPPAATALVARAHEIARPLLQKEVEIVIDGVSVKRVSWTDLGLSLDETELHALAAEVVAPKSALWRHRKAIGAVELEAPLHFDVEKAQSVLVEIKESYDQQAVDALLDFAHHTVTPDARGRRLDLYSSFDKLAEVLRARGDKLELKGEVLAPHRTVEEVKGVDAGEVLGYFQTVYAAAKPDRTFNLRRASSKIDGVVVFPGEVFDFNDVVGPRTEGNGFRVAPVIASGELVDGMGGGTCQIAGTLHAAAFFAGLEIIDRSPHTRPSFYIKMGLDAAVAFPTINLRLRNTLPFAVVMREVVEDGFVRAEILGPKRTAETTFVRKVTSVRKFPERYLLDPSLDKGAKVLHQRGIPGFHVVRYRVVQDGAFTTRERFEDNYPPTAQLWKVGSKHEEEKDKDGKKRKKGDDGPESDEKEEVEIIKGDNHPEYIADEYLEVRQGPGIRSPGASGVERGGGTVESRVAGKYGSYGWQVREGFQKSLDGKKEE